MACSRLGRLAVLLALLALCACGLQAGSRPDPFGSAQGVWMLVPQGPLSARRDVAGGWLGDSYVLVGGRSDPPCPPAAACRPPAEPALRDGARFDPVTGEWRPITDAPVPVDRWDSVVVDDELYVLTSDAGRADSPVRFVRYSPVGDKWTNLPLPGPDRGGVTLVGGNRAVALATSGRGVSATDMIFDGARQQWRRLPRDPFDDVAANRSAAWLDGRLLLAEGASPSGVSGADLLRLATLDPTSMTWTTLPPAQLGGGTPVVVAGRVVYPFFQVTGEKVGRDDQLHPNTALLDPSTGTWQMLPRPPRGKGLRADVIIAGDRVLAGGHLVDPRTGVWLKLPRSPWSDRRDQVVLGSPRSIFVHGGTSNIDSDPTNVAEAYLLRLPP